MTHGAFLPDASASATVCHDPFLCIFDVELRMPLWLYSSPPRNYNKTKGKQSVPVCLVGIWVATKKICVCFDVFFGGFLHGGVTVWACSLSFSFVAGEG